MIFTGFSPYDLLPDFFDPALSERWQNAEDRAHKTFIVLEWLEQSTAGQLTFRFRTH